MIWHRYLSLVTALLLATSCAGPVRRGKLKMPYDDRLKLASIYIQGGRTDRALPLLEDAVTQNAARPEAHVMLGEILYLKGDLEGSARHLTRALEIGGDDPVVLNNLAWIEMGRGHPEMALGLMDRAVRLEPLPLYPYLDTRSRILQALGRREEALTDARTALKQVPEYDTEMRDRLEELIKDLEGPDSGTMEEIY